MRGGASLRIEAEFAAGAQRALGALFRQHLRRVHAHICGAGVEFSRAAESKQPVGRERDPVEARERRRSLTDVDALRAQAERAGAGARGERWRTECVVDAEECRGDSNIAAVAGETVRTQPQPGIEIDVEIAEKRDLATAAQIDGIGVGELRERAGIDHQPTGHGARVAISNEADPVAVGVDRFGREGGTRGHQSAGRGIERDGRLTLDAGALADAQHTEGGSLGIHAGHVETAHADRRTVRHAKKRTIPANGCHTRHAEARRHRQLPDHDVHGLIRVDAALGLDATSGIERHTITCGIRPRDEEHLGRFQGFVVVREHHAGCERRDPVARCLAAAGAADQQAARLERHEVGSAHLHMPGKRRAVGVDDLYPPGGDVHQCARPALPRCRAQVRAQAKRTRGGDDQLACVHRQPGHGSAGGIGKLGEKGVGAAVTVLGVFLPDLARLHEERGVACIGAAGERVGEAAGHHEAAIGQLEVLRRQCVDRGGVLHHAVGTRKGCVLRRQQGVDAGRQARCAGEIHRLPHQRIPTHQSGIVGRRRAGIAGNDRVNGTGIGVERHLHRHAARVDRVVLREHVTRTARARHPLRCLQITATGEVDRGAVLQIHRARTERDGLARRCQQVGDVGCGAGIRGGAAVVAPVLPVHGLSVGHGEAVEGHRGDAPRRESQGIRDKQRQRDDARLTVAQCTGEAEERLGGSVLRIGHAQHDLAARRAQHAFLHDLRRHHQQAAAGRDGRAGVRGIRVAAEGHGRIG